MKTLSIGLIALGLALATPTLAEEVEWSIAIMNGMDDDAATVAAHRVGQEIEWELALASAALPCEHRYTVWDT
jgi:hypothetical protein